MPDINLPSSYSRFIPPETAKPTATRQRRPFANKRKLLTHGAVALASIALLTFVWFMWQRRLPRPNGNPIAIAKFVATPRFRQIDSARQQAYIDALRPKLSELRNAITTGELSQSDVRRAIGNVMQDRMRQVIRRYFDLPPGPKRDAYLDDVINRQQKFRANGPPSRPPADAPGAGAPASAASRAGRMKDRIENTPPEAMAQFAQFRADLQQRRKARGM